MAGKFASAKVEKLIRSAGAHRVSADAVDRLNEICRALWWNRPTIDIGWWMD